MTNYLGQSGALLPIGADGSDPTITALKSDIKQPYEARVALGRETIGRLGVRRRDCSRRRLLANGHRDVLGAAPPPGVVEVARQATLEVLGACGIPPSLFLAQSDGTAQRESFRRFLHTTLQPMA